MKTDVFALRHIGPREVHCNEMLELVGTPTIEELISETIPDNIRLSVRYCIFTPH
jgi:glycine dehydrogenase